MSLIFTIFLTAIVGVVSHYLWQWTYWKRRGMPGPLGYPILGQLGKMLDDKISPGITVREWTKKYGKVFGFTEGVQKVLVVSDPELVQEVFVKQFDNFYGRKLNPIQGDPEKDKDVHIIAAQGFRWKRLRTITAPVFSNNSIKKVLGSVEDSALEFMKYLEKNEGKSMNMSLAFQEYTLDVIQRIAMGQEGSKMFNNPMLKDCKAFFENNRWQVWMLGGSFPFAVHFLKFLFLKLGIFGAGPFINVNRVVTEAVDARIAQRDADRKDGIELEEPRDFIDLFLNAKSDEVEHFQEKNEDFHKSTSYNNRQLTRAETISQCFVFLVAGFDTTAISLSYVAYLTALNPRVQKKMQEEVDRECPDSEVTFDQLAKLKYLDSAIREAIRIYPLAAFATARRCMRTTKLGDHTVEAGVDVLVDAWTMHHDPKVWGDDVDEFRPERWDDPSVHQHFLSFGTGPRQCLGMRLVFLETKCLLVHMLSKYSISTTSETEIPLKLVGRTTMRPESLRLTVIPR